MQRLKKWMHWWWVTLSFVVFATIEVMLIYYFMRAVGAV